jgi:putative transposase
MDLGLSSATFYDWQQRMAQGQLDNQIVVPSAPRLPATPMEVEHVIRYAEAHPLLGYKRLTWAIIDENVAFLRPWMVYGILAEYHLLGRRAQAIQELERPAEPVAPDQRWHTDLMNLRIHGRWFYLIDFLDSYSRYLVYWEILLTAKANAVVLAGHRAIETLACPRQEGIPEIVHDNGPQFISHEWRTFVRDAQASDVPTLAHHPQSNGRVERFHRTTQEEALPGKVSDDLYRARETMSQWQQYYNCERPHSAIRYLRPIDYYRGDPVKRLAEREEKLRRGAVDRAAYWQSQAV